MGPRAVFVYYKISRAQVAQLQRAFAQVASTPHSWRAQLMRRAEAAGSSMDPEGDLQTWMEIYWLDEAAIVQSLSSEGRPGQARAWDHEAARQAIEGRARAAGIVDLIDGDRHYEAFESCA